jgi:hypothetical protein
MLKRAGLVLTGVAALALAGVMGCEREVAREEHIIETPEERRVEREIERVGPEGERIIEEERIEEPR